MGINETSGGAASGEAGAGDAVVNDATYSTYLGPNAVLRQELDLLISRADAVLKYVGDHGLLSWEEYRRPEVVGAFFKQIEQARAALRAAGSPPEERKP